MLKSPKDDFSETTLSAIPGSLGKLRYVAGLRQRNGSYFHWGLARSHGESNANVAIADAHSDVFTAILREPVSSLWGELRESASTLNANEADYVRQLLQCEEALIPADIRGGSRRHFNSVLLALSRLAGVLGLRTGPTS
jgi:hypothetical protein